MKTITYCIALVMWALALATGNAQEENEKQNARITILENSREQIVNNEKEALKKEVETINRRLENEEITLAEAELLKKAAAEKRALNIENKLAIIENKIELLKRNGEENGLETDKLELNFFADGEVIGFSYTPRKRKYDRRTTSDFVLAFGLNNVITKGESLEDSDFKVAGSRFAEIGWAWKTRVFKESELASNKIWVFVSVQWFEAY